ncbi:hypothetical protein M0805_003659 [Coniferiporia weirii]|nr:hypothetical protein M0805_003659 [Coniferiporia weirii]
MSQPENHSGTDQEFLYLKTIEIDFKENKPRRPISIKLKMGEDERRSRRFGRDELVNWDLGNYLRLSLPTDLAISIKEVHKIKRNKDIATFKLNLTSADVTGKDTLSADDTSGRVRAKLTFASPTDELVGRLVQEAQVAVGNKKVLLDSLGKAGKAIAVLMKFTDLASDVHPAAKAAFLLVGVLYDQFQAQQECHEEASALMKDVASLLPFVGDDVQALARKARTLQTVKEMLDLFCRISGLVLDYSGKGILGDLFSSRKDELDSSKDELRRLRATYDWCVKTEIWKSVIETGVRTEALRMRTEDIQLQQLCTAKRAYYDVGKGCLEGTRMSVLEQIRKWGSSEAGPGLFWLHGMAGSGKSAIANSVAHMFEEQQCLLGCFFSKKDDPECRVPMNVIPTLAMHFSKWHQTYRSMVASVIQGGDGPKLTQSLQWQFELLMKNPLTSLSVERKDLPPRPLVIVVDALDECGDSVDSRSELAGFLAKLASVAPWLKVVITSRPLAEFQQVFLQPNSDCRVLNVNTGVTQEQVQADIFQYTKHCAKNINLTDHQIEALASRASGLFIWTSTVFRFISAQHHKQRAINRILSQNPVDNPEAELDQIYTTVLKNASVGSDNAQIVKSPTGMLAAAGKDLHRILTTYYTPISVSTSHLYISALSWAPAESYAARTFYPHFQNQPLIDAGKEKNWNSTIWIANTGSAVDCASYSPDGRHIVSGSRDKILRIWDAQTGNSVVEALTGHSEGVNSVAYSPDGKHIVSCSWDKTLRIWDSQTGNPVGEPLTGHSEGVYSVAYSPDGRHIVLDLTR